MHVCCVTQYLLQQRSMEVAKGKEDEFRSALRQYIEDTNGSPGALK